MELQSEIEQIVDGTTGVMGVAIEDLKTGKRYLVNDQAQFYWASTIKIQVLVALLKKVHSGELNLDRKERVTAPKKTPGSGILRELETEIELSVKDLATLMIILSDNTAANMCVDLVSIDFVNATNRELGLTQTVLGRKFAGLFYDPKIVAEGRDNFSSPSDMMKTLSMIAKKEILDEKLCDLAIDIMCRTQFTKGILRYLPKELTSSTTPLGPHKVAHKYGSIPGICNDVGIVFHQKRPYVICVLSKEVEDLDGWNKIAYISKKTFDYFDRISRYP